MGENTQTPKKLEIAIKKTLLSDVVGNESMSVITPGGRLQVRWDERANATAMGQLAFFAEFLELSGLFERWVADCPLAYTSGNAPAVRDVLGTWMLSILDGHCRYAHIASLRGDAVAPEILNMSKIISDESLRRALAHIAPAPNDKDSDEQRLAKEAQVEKAGKWMKQALLESVQYALNTPWILDCDTTIKTLFGHQSGAEISYNPKKPGRPSHTVHTYWMANLRLVLHAELQPGKSHSAAHSLPGMIDLILRLPKEKRPKLVRGDIAFGTERVMCDLEEIDQSYLFKLKQTANVKRLVERQWRKSEWRDVGQGWQACEDRLQLMGWTGSRRVIVMRHAVAGELVVETGKAPRSGSKAAKAKAEEKRQLALQFIDENEPSKLWKYAVLVTNSSYAVEHMGQLYRDRADCENGFDELKNQWGWGGYSTQDIERCNLSAQAVGLIYNWWSWYVRLAHPQARLEAITSRPLLLAAVGKITEHAGQKRILLSLTHAAASQVKSLISNVREGLQHIRATAAQFHESLRWKALVDYIVMKILVAKLKNTTRPLAPPILQTG